MVAAAEEYGTPIYVYDYSIAEERLRLVEEALAGVDHVVAYAAKAAPILDLIAFLHSRGAWVEAVSGGEVYAALAAGVPPGNVIFDGVSKSPWEISFAVERGLYSIHAESLEEIRDIDEAATSSGVEQRVGVRVNLGVEVRVHRGLATSTRASKFGVEPARLLGAAEELAGLEGARVEGLHFHLGSGISDEKPYLEALGRALDLAAGLEERGLGIGYIDSGGGYSPDPGAAARILSAVSEAVGESGYRLIVEPGKLLVADAGALVARVNYVKELYGKKWALLDAGMNDYIRPMLYGVPVDLVCLTCSGEGLEEYAVAGPVCESTDVFATSVRLPSLRRGDLVAILGAGAYGWSMSSCYNMRPRPGVVAVYGGRRRLVAGGGDLSGLFSGQRVFRWKPVA